ncbi:hypothetical protein RF11_12143 [Thelohanellus kitauei]|uniref:Uncharacterized protein n=1 Tax=Thelohanellus kitauei TaxID=669202 RepID=A0A0C2IC86_THEKT|nr:hypothetical protein RF11_12143 [Thelohanellus kitauei]
MVKKGENSESYSAPTFIKHNYDIGHECTQHSQFKGDSRIGQHILFNAFLNATMNVLGQTDEFIFVLDNVNFHTQSQSQIIEIFQYTTFHPTRQRSIRAKKPVL